MAYFKYFRPLLYKGNVAKNIISRGGISNTAIKDTSLYYTYEVKEGDRPDITSTKIYQTPYYDWLIYLSNEIVDPYYDWCMSTEQFDNFIQKKYGSITAAEKQIYFYRVNWIQDDRALTPSGFQSLPTNIKKYWESVIDEKTGRVLKYVRKHIDITQNTNLIASLRIYNVSGSGLRVGERIEQGASYATVVHINESNIVVNSVGGVFTIGQQIKGNMSGTTFLHDTYTILKQNIPQDEAAYWTPVSYYEYELEKNEELRSIQLLSPSYASLAEEQLEQIMNV